MGLSLECAISSKSFLSDHLSCRGLRQRGQAEINALPVRQDGSQELIWPAVSAGRMVLHSPSVGTERLLRVGGCWCDLKPVREIGASGQGFFRWLFFQCQPPHGTGWWPSAALVPLLGDQMLFVCLEILFVYF